MAIDLSQQNVCGVAWVSLLPVSPSKTYLYLFSTFAPGPSGPSGLRTTLDVRVDRFMARLGRKSLGADLEASNRQGSDVFSYHPDGKFIKILIARVLSKMLSFPLVSGKDMDGSPRVGFNAVFQKPKKLYSHNFC